MDANFEFFAPDVNALTREEQLEILDYVAGREARDALPRLELKGLKLVYTFEIPDEQ
jgi:hypothetical protein